MNRFFAIVFFSMAIMLAGASALVSIEQVSVIPTSPEDDDTLRCEFIVTGDQSIYNVNVTWTVNGIAHASDNEANIGAQNNTRVSTTSTGDIEPADTSAGEIWVCVVSATDGISATTRSSSGATIMESEKLIISDISASCEPDNCDDDDLSETDAIERGDAGTVKEVAPGSTLTLKFRVRNNWPSSADNRDIENIELTCELEDIEDEDSQDESVDFDDLEPGERSDREEMSFTIPKDADEDTYTMDCTLEGEDEDGTSYSIDFTIDVDVEKERHSVVFTEASLSRSSISCDRDVTLDFEVQNVGGSDEDDVHIVLDSDELGIARTIFAGELEEGDNDDRDTLYKTSYRFTVDDDVRPGSYPILLEVFFDDGDDSNIETVTLTVAACSPVQPQVPGDNGASGGTADNDTDKPDAPKEQVEVVQQPYVPSFQGTQVVTRPAEAGKLDTYTILLVGAVVLLLVILAFMLGAVVRRR